MKRSTLNFLIDLLSAVVVLGITATGLIVRFVLPPGSGRGRVLWTWDRHEWGDLHFWLAVAAGALLLVHVALHWQWICVTTMRLFCRGGGKQSYPGTLGRSMAGVALVAGLTGLFARFIWLAQANVKATGKGSEHRGRSELVQVVQHGSGSEKKVPSIHGSMALGEVAEAGGISVDDLCMKLGLSAGMSPNERLGQLRQQYGFTMYQVREIVAGERPKDPRGGR